MEEWGNNGISVHKFSIAHRTSRSEVEEAWMCLARVRSRALITMGSGQMTISVLSMEVSTESLLERASAGAILVPGVTCQTISKSCKNSDHLACHLDGFQGSLMYERFLWSVIMVMGCWVPWRYWDHSSRAKITASNSWS